MTDDRLMRTTLDLDEDVLQSAKEIAALRGTTAGKVVSDLVRRALQPSHRKSPMRNGVPVLSRETPRARLVTSTAVNALLADE
jgi:hypothetical protein